MGKGKANGAGPILIDGDEGAVRYLRSYDDGGQRWRCWAKWSGQRAARDARRPTGREASRRLGSLIDGSDLHRRRRQRCRQDGSGRARNRAGARLNWAFQGQRWGRCKVRRRAERVSRPARKKKRRRRVLVVTSCSPRPMRAVQRSRLCAITWTASQAALAAKRQGYGIGVPWTSWRTPA